MGSRKKRHRRRHDSDYLQNGRFAAAFEGGREQSFAEQMRLWQMDLTMTELLARKGVPPQKTKSRQQPVPPLATLDLHGRTSAELPVLLDNFLLTQTRLGADQIRVITGKGLHSQGPPVLREALDQILRVLHFSGKITSFCWEEGMMDNSGAVFIRLRRAPAVSSKGEIG